MTIATIYGTVTVIFSGTDFHCHCFNSCSKTTFISSTCLPLQKKNKNILKKVTKNTVCFFSEYLVSEGSDLFPQK